MIYDVLTPILAGVPHQHLRHPPAETAVALSRVRGLPVSVGCKALLMKVGSAFTVVALRADRTMDNRAFRHAVGAQKLRFATREELWALTGCVPGQLPPFGHPVLPFRLVADRSVLDHDTVAFTAGTHTDSIVMATADWLAVARPDLLAFAT